MAIRDSQWVSLSLSSTSLKQQQLPFFFWEHAMCYILYSLVPTHVCLYFQLLFDCILLSLLFERQGLTWLRLGLNSLCSCGWLWTPDPSVSSSQVLGSQAAAHRLCGSVALFQDSHPGWASSLPTEIQPNLHFMFYFLIISLSQMEKIRPRNYEEV